MNRFLLILCCAPLAFAGGFDDYTWRLGFKLGADAYQPTLLIEYDYKVDGPYDTAALAVPRTDALHVFKMQYKVDGDKVEPVEGEAVTYWSMGEKVPVYLPPPGTKKVSLHALFTVANVLVIPAAPTAFTVPCKKLEVGFAPVPGFQIGGTFVGPSEAFNRRRVSARPGEPGFVFGFTRKGVKATTEPSLLFMFPKIFQFSFENLVGAVAGLEGSTGADSRAGSGSMAEGNNLKPYTMVFYREDPVRDWAYAPTWLQQETIYLPFGIEPGGRTKTRSLFPGSGDDRSDLLTWRATPFADDFFDGLPTEMDSEFDGVLPAVEKFREKFMALVKVNPTAGRLVAYDTKDGLSPGMANLVLATELASRMKLRAVPAFMTNLDPSLVGRLPLGGFSRVLTAFSLKGNWYFLDAADPEWTLKNSFERLTGQNVLILDGDNLRVASF